jgi:hypothetical protein
MRLSLFISIAISFACAGVAGAQDSAEKHDVPDADSRKKSLALVAATYRSHFESAKTNEQRIVLARELLRQAAEIADDPSGRFVTCRVARDIAAQAGGFETSMKAVDAIAQHYHVDALAMKASVTEVVAGAVKSKTASRDALASINKLIDSALFEDRFDIAKQFGRSALVAARKTRDGKLVKQVTLRDQDVAEIEKQYEAVEAALQVAQKNPNDPEANLTIGKYECFVKGDWQGGLDFLGHGNDEALKKLAMMEAGSPTSAEEQTALADGWWKAAQGETERGRHNIRRRAGHWYLKALPRLEGPAKAEAEKRLASLIADGKGGKWTDVLGAVDVTQGRVTTDDSSYVRGGWQWKKKVLGKKSLLGGAVHRASIPLPCETTGPFEIKLSFTPAEGKAAGLALSVPVGDRRLTFILRKDDHRATRLRQGGEQQLNIPLELTPGRTHKIHLRVESLQPEVAFSIQIDQNRPTQWTGKPEDVAFDAGSDPKERQGKFAIEVFRSRTVIHSIQFREL